LSSQGNYKLRIDLEDFSGISRYAVYNLFIVGDEASQYKLDVGGWSGDACKIFPVQLLSLRVARSLVFCVIFCRSLFVLLSFFV
jgi:hypothetical protein